jgi:hypothetical protein
MAAESYDAFVSYSHGDAEWVQALAGNLERLGLRVFLDAWELGAGGQSAVQQRRGLAASSTPGHLVDRTALGHSRRGTRPHTRPTAETHLNNPF